MNNREQLMDMITEHQLDRHQVADLLKVRRELVDRWLLSTESRAREEIPDMAIELLQLKLKLGMNKEKGSGAAS